MTRALQCDYDVSANEAAGVGERDGDVVVADVDAGLVHLLRPDWQGEHQQDQ